MGGTRILVVDDEEYVRKMFKRMLESEGWEVLTAESGEAALDVFEKEEVDIILLDVNMPGMKMITAIRSYSKGEMNLDVTILVGSSVILMGQTPEVSAETDEVKLTTSDIDGFKVIQAFDKSENGGYIVINIDKKETEGSLFMISYSGISSKEVLAIAKKFNWKKIKTTTGKLME